MAILSTILNRVFVEKTGGKYRMSVKDKFNESQQNNQNMYAYDIYNMYSISKFVN